MGGSPRGLTEVQLDYVHCLSFIYQARYFTTQVYQVGQAWLPLDEWMLIIPNDFLFPLAHGNGFPAFTFPRVEVMLTVLQFSGSFFLPFLKLTVILFSTLHLFQTSWLIKGCWEWLCRGIWQLSWVHPIKVYEFMYVQVAYALSNLLLFHRAISSLHPLCLAFGTWNS